MDPVEIATEEVKSEEKQTHPRNPFPTFTVSYDPERYGPLTTKLKFGTRIRGLDGCG